MIVDRRVTRLCWLVAAVLAVACVASSVALALDRTPRVGVSKLEMRPVMPPPLKIQWGTAEEACQWIACAAAADRACRSTSGSAADTHYDRISRRCHTLCSGGDTVTHNPGTIACGTA